LRAKLSLGATSVPAAVLSRCVALVCLALVVCSFGAPVGASTEPNTPQRTMMVGDSVIVECNNVTRVAISDPAVADVSVPSSKEILIVAKSPGATTLYIWDAAGRRGVKINVEDLKLDMDKLIADILKQINDTRITAEGWAILLFWKGLCRGRRRPRERSPSPRQSRNCRCSEAIQPAATIRKCVLRPGRRAIHLCSKKSPPRRAVRFPPSTLVASQK